MLNVEMITANCLHALLAGEGHIQLLDVRDSADFDVEHVVGSVNIPVVELAARLSQYNKHEPVILICTNGKKARLAASILREAGFTDIQMVAGGLLAWKVQHFPTQKAAV